MLTSSRGADSTWVTVALVWLWVLLVVALLAYTRQWLDGAVVGVIETLEVLR